LFSLNCILVKCFRFIISSAKSCCKLELNQIGKQAGRIGDSPIIDTCTEVDNRLAQPALLEDYLFILFMPKFRLEISEDVHE